MESGSPQMMVYRPRRLRWMAALGLAVLVLLLWQAYRLGHRQGGEEQAWLERREAELSAQITQLEAGNARLAEQLAVLERAGQVDAEAYALVKEDLNTLQDENLAQREELAFYRGIVSPANAKSGLTIQRLELDAAKEPGDFRYSLLLTQVIGNDRTAKGVVHLSVAGIRDGEPASLSLAEISRPKVDKLEYKFRYFQNLEGELHLPDDFTPQTVEVELRPSGKKKPKSVERTFGWPA